MATVSIQHKEQNPASVIPTSAPARYIELDRQYIGGIWRHGHEGSMLIDAEPFRRETLTEIVQANKDDLDEAYQSAAKAQISWAARNPAERAAIMLRSSRIMEQRGDEIVDWLIKESGSTRMKAELEWQWVYSLTVEAASYPHRLAGRILPIDEYGKESRAYKQPLGVIGVISPWNVPMILSQRSIAPALALGNAVVVKPAEDTPVSGGFLLAKIYEEAGLPPGVLNVVIGPIEQIGDAITLHPIPRLISFTGSTRVGRRIGQLAVSGPRIKRVLLELGGNAPSVILDDADIDQAVRSTAEGRFMHQGQGCLCTNRIIVDAKIHDEFVDRFTAHVKSLRCGDPNDPDTVIGPIINYKQLTSHLAHIAGARTAGARQVLGGDPQGLVLPPHIFADVKNSMAIARDETFGPIAPIIQVNGETEALRVANDTDFGLSSAVFTSDPERGTQFALKVQAGMTHVNDSTFDDALTGPFGGEKNSGIGRFGGEWIINGITNACSIYPANRTRSLEVANTRKTAIVTGASQGIGAGLVEAFLTRGYNVVANSRHITKASPFAASANLALVDGDIGDRSTAAKIVDTAVSKFGRIDVLINNAGIFIPKAFTEYTTEDFDTLVSTTLAGFLYVSQLAVKQMLQQKSGSIVNISTTLVDHPVAGVPVTVQVMTKGSLDAVTRALAMEYASEGIRVNTVALGVIKTPMHKPETYEFLKGLHPVGRMGEIKEVVDAVLFLTDATFTTGEILHVDGGAHAGKW